MGYYLTGVALGVLAAAWLVSAAGAQTLQSQAPLPEGMQQFVDANGAPYAGGHVFMYVPATTTPKATYADPYGATANPNPITLDANGRGVIWGNGIYRQILQDALGVTVWDQLTATAVVPAAGATGALWYGVATGTANAITLNGVAGFTGTDGQRVGFVASATNTGSVTVNPTGFGAVLVEKNTPVGLGVLVGREFVQGNVYYLTYSKANNAFLLEGGSFFSATQASAANEPLGTLQVMKTTAYSGGTVGNLEAAAWVQNTVADGVATSQLGVFGYLLNSSTQALPAAQNVAVGGYATCLVTGCSATFGGWFVGKDSSGQSDPTNPLLGAEIDVFALGTDSHLARAGLVIVGGKDNLSGTAPTINKAIAIGDNNDGTHFNNGLQIEAHSVGTELNLAAASAGYGAYFSGTITTATIQDTTTGPDSVLIGGTHSDAALHDVSTSAAGLFLNGTYSGSAVQVNSGGVGLFQVLPSGAVNALKGSVNVHDSGSSYYIHDVAGTTATKTAGACTFTLIGGLVTNVSGC